MKLKWLIAPTKFLANIGNIALSYNSAKFRPLWVFEKRRPKSAALLAFRSREVPPLNGRLLLADGGGGGGSLRAQFEAAATDGCGMDGSKQANWAHTHSPVGWALGLLSPRRPSSGGGRGWGALLSRRGSGGWRTHSANRCFLTRWMNVASGQAGNGREFKTEIRFLQTLDAYSRSWSKHKVDIKIA